MTTLILGAAGLLGQALTEEGNRRGEPLIGLDRDDLDITDGAAVAGRLRRELPTRIVNCAALTAVDECETRDAEARAVNGCAVEHLVSAARSVGSELIQISTDYVFDGTAREPYAEDAPTSPLCVYGESKLAGELAALAYERALVVRTSWLFGSGGVNFVARIAESIEAGRKPLRVVDDELGCPTYAPFLARALWDVSGLRWSGILHYRNRDPVSWHAFASEIASLLGDPDEVVAVSHRELARPASRPAYSVLDVTKFESLMGRRVEDWRDGLVEYLQTIRDKGRS